MGSNVYGCRRQCRTLRGAHPSGWRRCIHLVALCAEEHDARAYNPLSPLPAVTIKLPRLYPILDAGLLAKRGISIAECAQAFCDARVMLLQYRDKLAMPQDILRNAEIIQKIFEGTGATLILDDRADLAALAG